MPQSPVPVYHYILITFTCFVIYVMSSVYVIRKYLKWWRSTIKMMNNGWKTPWNDSQWFLCWEWYEGNINFAEVSSSGFLPNFPMNDLQHFHIFPITKATKELMTFFEGSGSKKILFEYSYISFLNQIYFRRMLTLNHHRHSMYL